MPVGKVLLAERTKALGGKHFSPFLGVEPGSIALKGLHDAAQRCDPWHAFVAEVPDQTKSTTWLENAADFMKRFRGSKPVKRLRANDCIDRPVPQRYGFGG